MDENQANALTADSTDGGWLRHPAGSLVFAAFADKIGMERE